MRVVGTSQDPVTVQFTTRQDQLIVTASIPQGSRFEPDGLQLMSGSRNHPLTLALPADGTSPLRLTSGAYCVVRADLSDGMWGLLGTINGDLAYEFERTSLAKRIDEVSFENEPDGGERELYGPWQTRMRLSDEATSRAKALERTITQERRADTLPLFRDRAALLSDSKTPGPAYLNWPRFRRALAIAMGGAMPALVERLELIGQSRPRPERGPPAARTTRPDAGVPPSRRARRRDAAPFQPPAVAMNDEARTYALMRLLPSVRRRCAGAGAEVLARR